MHPSVYSVLAAAGLLAIAATSQAAVVGTVQIDFLDPVASTTTTRTYGTDTWNQVPLLANKQTATLPSTPLATRNNTASGISVSAPDWIVGGYTNGTQGNGVAYTPSGSGFTFSAGIMDSIVAEDFTGTGLTARNGLIKLVFTSSVPYTYDFLIASSMGSGANADGEWLTTFNLGYGAVYGGKNDRTFSGGVAGTTAVTVDSAGLNDQASAALSFTSVQVGSDYIAELQIAVGNQNLAVINRPAVINALKFDYSTPIPEPAAAGLAASAAVLLGVRRRARS